MCVFLLMATTALAQDADFREAVVIDSPPLTTKRLGNVVELIEQRDWPTALTALRELQTDVGDDLVRVQPGLYRPVEAHVRLLIAQLPPAGLEDYRQQADVAARPMLALALARRDHRLLRQLLAENYSSRPGDEALWTLGLWAWQADRLNDARQWWTQLLPLPAKHRDTRPHLLRYPDSSHAPAEVRARLVLCSLMDGDLSRAANEIAAFRDMHGDATGTLGGETGNLAERLDDIFSAEAASRAHERAVSAHAPQPVEIGPVLWQRSLPPVGYPITYQRQPALPSDGPLSYLPVTDGEHLLVHDADHVWSVDVDDGDASWTAPLATQAVSTDPLWERLVPFTMTQPVVGVVRWQGCVSRGRYFARVGEPILEVPQRQMRTFESRLICLDIATGEGRLQWSAVADELFDDAEVKFAGEPVAVESRLYLPIVRAREQLRVGIACLDAQTGRLLWEQPTCSVLTDVERARYAIGNLPLSHGSGSVVLTTNYGAIAAVEAKSGRPQWTVTYQPREPPDDLQTLSTDVLQSFCPAIIHNGSVIVQPRDSDRLMCIDQASGLTVWSVEPASRVRHLLGVVGETLIVSGNVLTGYDLRNGQRLWQVGFADPPGFGYGRGAIEDRFVYWPMREEIFIVDGLTGVIVDRVPIKSLHDIRGGNLLLTDERLLIARPNEVIALGVGRN